MATPADPRRIGQILLERGLISAPQLEEVIKEQLSTGRFVGELLVARGILSEEQIARALSEQLGFAFVDLKTIEPEAKALELIGRDICEKYLMIPVFLSQNSLTIAMANPLDVNATGKAQEMAGTPLKTRIDWRTEWKVAYSNRKISAKQAGTTTDSRSRAATRF